MKLKLIAMIIFALSTIGLGCLGASETSTQKDEGYSSLKIYFIDWEIITRTTLSPADIRKMRHNYTEINDHETVSKVLDIIKDDFHNRSSKLPEAARLVVDFVKKDGTIKTFYANQSHILNEDSTKSKIMTNSLINALSELIGIKEIRVN